MDWSIGRRGNVKYGPTWTNLCVNPLKLNLYFAGYYGDGFNALVVFAGCYLPDKSRRDYNYVMDNLFL